MRALARQEQVKRRRRLNERQQSGGHGNDPKLPDFAVFRAQQDDRSAEPPRVRGRAGAGDRRLRYRTSAEYLGAAWLAQAVRAGLPIGRVIALMGVDGHPAPELRGLPFAVARWRQ
jgi:hypothetical protein